MLVHTCNPSTQEDLRFEASLGYIAGTCLKKTARHPPPHSILTKWRQLNEMMALLNNC
jgi:hypothetical protein